jgi:Fe-Mn family superoxide dismutase
MAFALPDLPYPDDGLEPHISRETIAYHHGKHHRAYVDNLNKMTADTAWAEKTLEEIVREADGGVFNNAAQVWNHTFYWSCLSPDGGGEPAPPLATRINYAFGDFAAFKEKFTAAAIAQFGSGWAWLVSEPSGRLLIQTTSNADTPLRHNAVPILTCDVWEHAYYIDYRNSRPQYLEHFWELVNWDFVASNI